MSQGSNADLFAQIQAAVSLLPAVEAKAKAFAAQPQTPADFAMLASRGRYKMSRHLDFVNKKLTDLANTKIKRLILCFPPRHSKSETGSKFFPAWYIGRFPDRRVILASYESNFAASWGEKARDLLSEFGQSIFGVKVSETSAARDEWRIEGRDGGMVTAGVGGAVVGRGCDCVVSGTMIHTDAGIVSIDYLYDAPFPCKILSYGNGKLSFREAEAFRRSACDGIYRITTTSGRVVEVTTNHRFYVAGKYVEANSLSAGDPLLLAVPQRFHSASVRSFQGRNKEELRGPLLFGKMLSRSSRHQKQPAMQEVREIGGEANAARILRGVPTKATWTESGPSGNIEGVSNLQSGIYGKVARCWQRDFRNLLQQVVRGARSLTKNVGSRKSEMEARRNAIATTTALSQGISVDATTYSGAGRSEVCGLQVCKIPSRSSHRRMADEQCGIESCCSLQQLPSEVALGEGFSAIEDTVAVVERIRKEAIVYDIQVKENRNFFANGILVHNCLIIDDYVKNSQEASSKTIRDRTWNWWQSTAMTRLEPNGIVLIIGTRWHEDDLIGRLLAEQNDPDEPESEKWQLINLPAIAEENDAIGRKPGEALWPYRYDEKKLNRIKRRMNPYLWNALYQQRPLPPGGEIFNRGSFRFYETLMVNGTAQLYKLFNAAGNSWTVKASECRVFLCADTASSEKESADYTVCQVWLLTPSYDMLLLDIWREQARVSKVRENAVRLYRQWECEFAAVEKNGVGLALLQSLRDAGLTVMAVEARVDKVMRAQAAEMRMSAGMIHFPKIATFHRDLAILIDELESFPKGVHDDGVDTLCWAAHVVNRIGGSVRDREDVEYEKKKLADEGELAAREAAPGGKITSLAISNALNDPDEQWLRS